ncbi:hypothetical protein [Paenibacillus sp. MMO-177]|uniref:hypothetical protein n=1 Tax=Paenibacillus sp. MMO-177 TaxID=3081289 RepID=UPI00301A86A9
MPFHGQFHLYGGRLRKKNANGTPLSQRPHRPVTLAMSSGQFRCLRRTSLQLIVLTFERGIQPVHAKADDRIRSF